MEVAANIAENLVMVSSGTSSQEKKLSGDESNTRSIPVPNNPTERETSVDSAAFFDQQDEYDDVDDFQLGKGSSGGGGGGGGKSSKMSKKQANRGGSGNSGNIYSAKHVRQKEAQKAKPSKK